MEIYYILDASAFINGFKPTSENNFTVPEITAEIKDFKSRLAYDSAVDDGILTVQDVSGKYLDKTDEIISKSGDVLRLSLPDKKIIPLILPWLGGGSASPTSRRAGVPPSRSRSPWLRRASVCVCCRWLFPVP